MFVVEWIFELGGRVTTKLCRTESERAFWLAVAISQKASLIVTTEVGVC